MELAALICAFYWRHILGIFAVGFIVIQIADDPIRALGYIGAIVGLLLAGVVAIGWFSPALTANELNRRDAQRIAKGHSTKQT